MSTKMEKVTTHLTLPLYEFLTEIAKEKKISVGTYIRKLLTQYGVGKKDVKTVVLQVPLEKLQNKEEFQEWLAVKSNALAEHLFQEKTAVAKE